MAPHMKKTASKSGEFLALKWHHELWSWHGAKPKNHYESTTYKATELKRRAANYSDSLSGLGLFRHSWARPLGDSVIGFGLGVG